MPNTQEETVLQALREGIIKGDVPVGIFLSQRKLALQFGTSLITLRAALRRLESEGLIESVPRWGVRIPEATPAEVRDRYFLRETLELAALEQMFSSLDAVRRAHLLALAASCDASKGEDETAIYAFARVHHAFHRCLVEYAQSRLLLEAYDRLMARNLMLNNAQRVWAAGRDHEADYHRTLVRDLLEQSPAKARTALRTHIRRGLEHEMQLLEWSCKRGGK